jgi:hypothetical protein
MLVLLLTIDALPEVRMLGAVHQLDRVPVLPRLRELRWNGPPLPAVRLPYGHAPDVQTRVFSVQDGQLRAIVKRMPHSSSCARLPGIDRCPTSKICNHRRLAEGANEDLAEPAPPEQETTPDEHARLVELQAGSPIDLTVCGLACACVRLLSVCVSALVEATVLVSHDPAIATCRDCSAPDPGSSA